MLGLAERQLGLAGTAVAESFDALQAKLGEAPDIDLVIVDLDLPGMSGEVGLRYLTARHPGVRVAVLFGSLNENKLDVSAIDHTAPVTDQLPESSLLEALGLILSGAGHALPSTTGSILPGHPTTAQLTFLDHELTTRQRDVLRLLSQGQSNREIAHGLGIAEGTVKVHVNAAFRGLGVHNRVSAAVAFREYFETRPAQDG